MKSILLVLLVGVLSLGATQLVSANSVKDEIAARLKAVGSVCVEGEDCASGSAVTSVATAGGGDSSQAIYDRTCATCHTIGVAGAPKLADIDDWAPRIAKGMDVLYNHGINGLAPGMPAKGLCFACSDDEIKAVVDYMVQASK